MSYVFLDIFADTHIVSGNDQLYICHVLTGFDRCKIPFSGTTAPSTQQLDAHQGGIVLERSFGGSGKTPLDPTVGIMVILDASIPVLR